MTFFFKQRSSTGIFIPSKNGFSEYKGDVGDGSINSIIINMGHDTDRVYAPDDVHSWKGKIKYLCFELFTRKIVFVLTDTKTTYITEKDIKKLLVNFSVKKHFESQRISDSLTQGIENSSLTIEFLAKVLKLENLCRNGMFYSEKIDTYLYFTNGILTDFHQDDGLFPGARNLQKVNSTVYNYISSLAYKYWPDDEFQAKKEINIQSEAWSSIPGAFGNEFIPHHRTENGGANMHMIRVCHYGYPINLSQFKEINHGRYQIITDHSDALNPVYNLGKFNYQFDLQTEMLHNVTNADQV